MSTQRYHLYAIGNALVDTEAEVEESFLAQTGITKGVMTLAEHDEQKQLLRALNEHTTTQKHASGGSAANTAIAASYFGARTFYSCRVADDATGRFYVQDLQAAGVDTNMASARPDGTSGTCVVMVTPDAERTMYTHLAISANVSTEDLNEEAIRQSDYIYIEGYLVSSDSARAAACRLRDLGQQHGAKVALTLSDPAMVQFFREGLKEMIGDGLELIFCNEEEAKQFTETDTIEAALDALKTFAQQVVITRGPNGAIAWDGDTLHNYAGVPVKAIDTTGAGDLFAGAFMYALSAGHGFAAAGPFACHAAAEVITDFGPRIAPERYPELLNQHLRS